MNEDGVGFMVMHHQSVVVMREDHGIVIANP
jgi:hypothetical protein